MCLKAWNTPLIRGRLSQVSNTALPTNVTLCQASDNLVNGFSWKRYKTGMSQVRSRFVSSVVGGMAKTS